MTRRTAGSTSALRALAAVAALACALAGCASGGDDTPTERAQGLRTSTTAEPAEPVPGGELTVATEGENSGWVPGRDDVSLSFGNVTYALYDPLLVTGADGESHPYLAASVEHDEALLEWTVRLRPEVRFHDGTPLTAEVMKRIFDDHLMAEGSIALGLLDEVAEVRVDDELTFTYVLTKPNGAFPFLLTGPVGMPFSPASVESGGLPAGTGPFRMESWTADERLVVVRNDDYWRPGLPHLDRITFVPVPDEELRVDLLLNGTVDAIQALRGTPIKRVRAAEGFTAHTHAGDDSSVAYFNISRPPLDDIRIRRAAAQMYDPEAIQAILGDDGLVEVSSQFFGADSPWYSERVAATRPPYDPEAARALVDDYVNDPNRSDGKPVGTPPAGTFMCLTDPAYVEMAEHIKQDAERTGLSVTLEPVDAATLVSRSRGSAEEDPPFQGDFTVACNRSQSTGDPAATFGNAFGAPHEEAGNLSNFATPELSGLIGQLRSTDDFNERYVIVERIGTIINDAVPMTFVSGTPSMVGVRDGVENVATWTTPEGAPGEGLPFGVAHWGEVWVER